MVSHKKFLNFHICQAKHGTVVNDDDDEWGRFVTENGKMSPMSSLINFVRIFMRCCVVVVETCDKGGGYFDWPNSRELTVRHILGITVAIMFNRHEIMFVCFMSCYIAECASQNAFVLYIYWFKWVINAMKYLSFLRWINASDCMCTSGIAIHSFI